MNIHKLKSILKVNTYEATSTRYHKFCVIDKKLNVDEVVVKYSTHLKKGLKLNKNIVVFLTEPQTLFMKQTVLNQPSVENNS